MSDLQAFSATDLMAMNFPEPRWAVRGLICEGLNLIVGAPKFGKSWFCLNLAVAIASGGKALGQIEVEKGSVLYCALEDTPRRLQSRLNIVLGGDEVPDGITFVTEMPRMPEATNLIAEWLHEHHDARLVIIDVLRKVRSAADGRTGRSAYDEDYDSLGSIKRLADEFGIAVLVVHHTRKMADESDVFNEVAGSTGITGAADAILVAKRSRNAADAVLHLTGRDVVESEFGLLWDETRCQWNLAGDSLKEAAHAAVTAKVMGNVGDTMLQIIELAATYPMGIRAANVADALSIPEDTARRYMSRAENEGRLERIGRGIYASVRSVPSVPLPSQEHIADVIPLSGVSRSSRPNDESDNGTHRTPDICATCHEPMAIVEPGQTTHPNCGGGDQ
ncbi:AAA domain-containing protein [Luteococcus japonicus]|uniref:AAA domain-containing protein n=1 Tax=Luteococcus japonicus TaxID=33984 RepID=A0A3N1ZQZ0_9ACTN|nr:AAA family ATPase [Luteococcus japonicus]ROR53276.1 AAA domain-containing protein [Luteococcus japonicus]